MVKVWIYRPDVEWAACRINRNFLYNACRENYFEAMDRQAEMKKELERLKEKRRQAVMRTKMEVPND